MSDTTDNSGTRNPVPENLVLSSGSASDSDSSAENEEVVAQPEQPGDVVLEGEYFIYHADNYAAYSCPTV